MSAVGIAQAPRNGTGTYRAAPVPPIGGQASFTDHQTSRTLPQPRYSMRGPMTSRISEKDGIPVQWKV